MSSSFYPFPALPYTLAEAQAKRANVMAAYDRAVNSREYHTGSRGASHQSLKELQAQLEYWSWYINLITGQGSPDFVKRAVSIDR